MISRHYFDERDNGGAVLRPQRSTNTGAYALDDEIEAKARAFIRKHAADADALIDMLGLTEHDQT